MSKKDKYGYRETFPRYFKADYELQNKVGTGTLDTAAVSKVQEYLDTIQTDVTPQLRDTLDLIESALATARSTTYGREEFLPAVTKPLMDVKALSGMFGQMMVCRVSAFVLTFVEDVRKLDSDVLDIVGGYLKVARTLIDLGIKEETNPHGQSFLAEIRNACKRYYDKQASMIRG